MPIKFYLAEDIKRKFEEIVRILELSHIDTRRVICMRSLKSASRRTLARCYALPKIWQLGLKTEAHYIIEVISERFDRLSEDEKTKVVIHEIMHIPGSFGGGFRHHSDHVTERNVERLFSDYQRKKRLLTKGQSLLPESDNTNG